MGSGGTKEELQFNRLSSEATLTLLSPELLPVEQFPLKPDEITLNPDQHNAVPRINTLELLESTPKEIDLNTIPQNIDLDFFETSKKEPPELNLDSQDFHLIPVSSSARPSEVYVIDDALQMSSSSISLAKEASTSPLVSHFLIHYEKKFEMSDIFEISSSSGSSAISSELPKDISNIPTAIKQFASVGYANFDFNFIDENARKLSSLPNIKQDKKLNIYDMNQLIEELDL